MIEIIPTNISENEEIQYNAALSRLKEKVCLQPEPLNIDVNVSDRAYDSMLLELAKKGRGIVVED